MFKPLSPVPLPQWRSAGVLHLVELLTSLDTGSSMAIEISYYYLQLTFLDMLVFMRTNKDSIGENVSVRSEANQLFSELVTVTVTMGRSIVIKVIILFN